MGSSERDPSNVQAILDLGALERSRGDSARAAQLFRRATEIAPRAVNAWFNLGLTQRETGRLREAALAFRQAALINPLDFDAVQNVVSTIALATKRGERLFSTAGSPKDPARGEGVSIVVCSVDEGRLERFEARMRPHLAARAHEIIAIRDARSLAEGYRRGWKASRHPIVVFCHDDFSILSCDPFAEIETVLESADIVGLAGSRRASGPAVLWAGHPHIHGWIAHPARDRRGLNLAVLSLESGMIGGMQTLDGVFMAMRRDIPGRVGFDEKAFDGFHFYDLDFSYSAARAGLRLAVTTNVVALHESTGNFDAAFDEYSRRFRAKFPELSEPRGAHHWYDAPLDDEAKVVMFCEELRALAATP